MAKPNYQFEKRQRDLAKKKKKEEKLMKKQQAKATEGGEPGAEPQPADGKPAAE